MTSKMWCCAYYKEKQALREQVRVNKEIDEKLSKDKRNSRKKITFLLLGTSGSGKSTFIKQLKDIWIGYSDGDKRSFVKLVYQDILMDMQAILKAMTLLHIPCADSSNNEKADIIRAVDIESVTTLEYPYAEAIKSLWNDLGIQECYDRRKEYEISDSAKYFLNDFDRIASSDYLPTEEDILRTYSQTTTGIVDFSLDGDYWINRFIDINRQQSERRKWIHHFENVDAIIFFVALNDFDKILFQPNPLNGLEESKNLFKTIVHSPWFKNSKIILFFNKKDLFEEKIKYSHLVNYFPEFEGPQRDAISAREFILRMYVDMNPDSERIIYSHFTCAINAVDIQHVFRAVQDSWLEPLERWEYRNFA